MTWIKKIFSGVSSKELIQLLEQIYNDLKIQNPDKDEHWLLANTWLTRYGSWKASKQKGPKLTRYIAYTTTFDYSLLDSPRSIRGLALFLAYKELGDKEAEDGAKEFAQITESLEKIKEGNKLMDVYKQKNPFTWNEIQAEKDMSIYGLYGFLKIVDYLNKNPEEQKRALEKLEKLDRGEKIELSTNNIKFSEDQIAEIKRATDKD